MASASFHRPMPISGLAAGLMPDSRGDPATVRAANAASQAATDEKRPDERKDEAGQIVHYLFGAGLGAVYGLLAEFRPSVTRGLGSGFGITTATLFDELATRRLLRAHRA